MPLLNQASSFGQPVDRLFFFFFVVCVTVLLGVSALILYFVVRYSRERNPKPTDIEGHVWLEIVWTAVPTVLFLVMFYFGWTNFSEMRSVPSDAMVVEVVGKQWEWTFNYPNGKTDKNLYLAMGRPVKLELVSRDVLHGFSIAAFRVKMDVVPGKRNYLWFMPTILGEFDIQCTVICGTHHSYMTAKAHVLTEDEFKVWYFEEGSPDAERTK